MPAVWRAPLLSGSPRPGRLSLETFRGVLFDWRGTLVVSPTFEGWAAEALRRLSRPHDGDATAGIAARLERAGDDPDAPGMDADAGLHRRTYLRVLAGLGLDPDLVTALYEVECDPASNTFADDGGAVEVGLVTLLLPPLASRAERRLQHVAALCGVPAPGISQQR